MPKKIKFDFAPSLCHNRLMNEMEQKFAYDGGDLKKWRAKLGRQLKQLLGSFPEKRAPLNITTLWKREHPLGKIEKIVFTSEPGADVPAYVCIPRKAAPPYDFMICLQGHSSGMHNEIAVDKDNETKSIESKKPDADRAVSCMKRGVAALCVEQRGFGERKEIRDRAVLCSCYDTAMHAFMLGRTLVGERVFDVDRAIDYLETRRDVNFKTLGITGNSGGGTTSIYAAAMLPRLKIAMPSCSFGTYRESKMSVHHCACGYIPDVMLYADMPDIMGLFAPSPVVIVAGRDDDVVPLAAVRKGFAGLKRIYKAAGAGDRCHLVVGNGGHRFYADQAWPFALREMAGLRSDAPLALASMNCS